MRLFQNINVDWIGKKKYFFALSITLVLLSIAGFVKHRGPVLGIEFTGGTLFQIGFKDLPDIENIRKTLNEAGWAGYSLQTQPVDHTIIIRVKTGDRSNEDISAELLKTLQKSYAGNVSEMPLRVEFVGPVVGDKLAKDAFLAVFGSLGLIIVYVAFRFKSWVWGFAGVVALAHDVFISLGLLTLLGHETTLVVVAALLTLAGYSINDTIVIFDRVREELRISRKETMAQIMNKAINETMARTINTSMTTFLTCLSLLLLGGEVIKDFAIVLTFGIVVGVYSTVGVATGLVHSITERKSR